MHWTPIEVALQTIDLLNLKRGDNVLDIGSGVGKFCLIGAQASNANFFGVELREDFVEIASNLALKHRFTNVNFIHDDIVNIDFTNYSAFYFYNPFCEMLSPKVLIDDQVTFSREKHRQYEDFVFDQLELLPIGTRVVTYCSPQFVLPVSYELRDLYFEGTLSLWEKVKK